MGITSPPAEGTAGGGEPSQPMPFKFVAWGGSADVSFWHRLADFKLDTQKLTEEPITISDMDCVVGILLVCSVEYDLTLY